MLLVACLFPSLKIKDNDVIKLLDLYCLCGLFIHLKVDTKTPIDRIRSHLCLQIYDSIILCKKIAGKLMSILLEFSYCQLQEFVHHITYFISILLNLLVYFQLQKLVSYILYFIGLILKSLYVLMFTNYDQLLCESSWQNIEIYSTIVILGSYSNHMLL